MKNLQTFLANFNVVILLVGYQVFTAVFEAIFDVDSELSQKFHGTLSSIYLGSEFIVYCRFVKGKSVACSWNVISVACVDMYSISFCRYDVFQSIFSKYILCIDDMALYDWSNAYSDVFRIQEHGGNRHWNCF